MFVLDPFRPLPPNLYAADIVSLAAMRQEMVDALSHYLGLQDINRTKLIKLGVKKGAEYDVLNEERYDIQNRLEALYNQHDFVKHIMSIRNNEMKHLQI